MIPSSYDGTEGHSISLHRVVIYTESLLTQLVGDKVVFEHVLPRREHSSGERGMHVKHREIKQKYMHI